LNTIASRLPLLRRLGQQYGGSRDLYEALGYKNTIEIADYFALYRRGDIAKRIVDAPVDATWRGEVEITTKDSTQAEDRDLEEDKMHKAFVELDKRLSLTNRFSRADRLASIGHFSILFLGFSDAMNESDLKNAVDKSRSLELKFVFPYSQTNATIHTYDTDATSETFGLPLLYKIVTSKGDNSSKTITVHRSRVIHIVEDKLESEVLGIPRLEAVYNRFDDLAKLAGGSAEMFWRGARPGYAAILDKDATMDQPAKDAMKEQLDEYDHGLRRFLRLSGMDIKSMDMQIADPENHVKVQLQLISGTTGIPMRILTGSERGELASSQDEKNWLVTVSDRRTEFAEPEIVRQFIDRMQEFGLIDEGEYVVKWPDLFAKGEKDQAEIAKAMTEAISKYASSPGADMLIPPAVFLKEVMGFEQDVIDTILATIEAAFGDDIDPEDDPADEIEDPEEVAEEEANPEDETDA
jgi:hypothetical protein